MVAHPHHPGPYGDGMTRRAVVEMTLDEFSDVIAPGLPDVAVDYVEHVPHLAVVHVGLTGDGLPERCEHDPGATRAVLPMHTVGKFLDERIEFPPADDESARSLSRREVIAGCFQHLLDGDLTFDGAAPSPADVGVMIDETVDSLSTLLGVRLRLAGRTADVPPDVVG